MAEGDGRMLWHITVCLTTRADGTYAYFFSLIVVFWGDCFRVGLGMMHNCYGIKRLIVVVVVGIGHDTGCFPHRVVWEMGLGQQALCNDCWGMRCSLVDCFLGGRLLERIVDTFSP